MIDHPQWIVLLPFLCTFLVLAFGRWMPRQGAVFSMAGVGFSFMLIADLLLRYHEGSLSVPHEVSWTWFSVGVFDFSWGFLLDGLSLLMGLVVTGVSFMVQLYSHEYLPESPRLRYYFASLSLFTTGMLLVVFSNNYFQLFIGWELMGLCSYLLIGYDMDREAAGAAANKAFLTTRLGDLGFYAALLMLFLVLGTFNFAQAQERLADGGIGTAAITAIALLLFASVIGKSAQFPLHVWLPDAMEGPTPVSALIHSATMVAAGIYLTARSMPIFAASPAAMEVVAWVGGGTALMAALFAVVASDIKKILAFSTISQLGLMLLGLGVGGYSAGVFHMVTHAAFKALLFLAAGSVIHAVHTNDIWKMGSLSKQMAVTFTVFLCGALALAGFPFTSGWYSKDLLLEAVYQQHRMPLLALGLTVSGLTAFYVARLVALVFLGEPRERDRFAHAQESAWPMTAPMLILAVLALGAGLVLHMPALQKAFFAASESPDHGSWVVYAASAMSVGGLLLGFAAYIRPGEGLAALGRAFHPVHRFLSRQAYLDELYAAALLRPLMALARGVEWADRQILDRIFVDGFKAVVDLLLFWRPVFPDGKAENPRTAQGYLMLVMVGLVFILYWNSR